MDEKELEARLELLLEEMTQEPEDEHELFLQLQQVLNGMRGLGMPVPQDLADLEATLAEKFTVEGASEA